MPTGSPPHDPTPDARPQQPRHRWTSTSADPTRVSAARLYDYLLDGKDNFAVDREAARSVERVVPEIKDTARANRHFLTRAVTLMTTEFGIRQFLDVGTGIPTSPSVHEIVGMLGPRTRVAYVDADPVVHARTRALLSDGDATLSLQHDLRDPRSLVDDERLRAHLDFSRPVGLLFVAVMHFVSISEAPSVMQRYRDAVPPGSCLALSAVCSDGSDVAALRAVQAIYRNSDVNLFVRTGSQVEALFAGFRLTGPLADVTRWRVPAGTPHGVRVLAGLGVKD